MSDDSLVHLDPWIGSTNLGDLIISEAVQKQITQNLPCSKLITLASRQLSRQQTLTVQKARRVFLGGTNAFHPSPIFNYYPHQLPRDIPTLLRLSGARIIFLGVGAYRYFKRFGLLADFYYARLLDPQSTHSVRDEYTRQKLLQLGFSRVLNTGCPTMWDLSSFSDSFGDAVLLTLTGYRPDEARDIRLLRAAMKKFRHIRFWPQGFGQDRSYLASILSPDEFDRIEILPATLTAFDESLAEGFCHLGTRLHAGIRALQSQRPSLVVPVDNRAGEMSDSIQFTDPELTGIQPGTRFSFAFKRRPEADEFLSRFAT